MLLVGSVLRRSSCRASVRCSSRSRAIARILQETTRKSTRSSRALAARPPRKRSFVVGPGNTKPCLSGVIWKLRD